jgi:hypothetical protein
MFRSAFLAVLATLPALPVPASAAILWFGGEDTSFTCVGTCASTNGGNQFDASFARTSMSVQNGTSTSDPPTNLLVPAPATFTACNNPCWIHLKVSAYNVITTTNNEQFLILYGTDGVGRLYLRQTGANGTLKLSIANAARTFTDLATSTATYTNAYPAGTITQIDLGISSTCSSGDTAVLYINNVQGISYTGNLCTDANTQWNKIAIGSISNTTLTCVSDGSCISEVIVASEDTRSMRLATLILQAAGNTQGWTPNTLANVNKATISDGTFVSDSTGNVLSQWKVQTAAPTGTWGVKAVSIESRLLASITGPQNFDWSWRISGSDYLAGTTTALTNNFANYRLQRDTSPATGTTWGISEVFNTSTNQMNIGVKSLP